MPVLTRSRGRHRGWWIAGGIVLFGVLLLVAARIALTPLVAHLTRKQLNAQARTHGDFKALSLSVLGLSYHLDGLELHMTPPGGTPITSNVESLDAHLLWHDLLRFHIVAEVVVDHVKVVVEIENPDELKAMLRQLQHLASMRGLGAQLEEQPPFRLQRMELRNFELLIEDHTEPGVDPKSAQIWVHDMQVTLENLADRAELLGGRPSTLAAKGKVQRSGDAKLFATVDPLSDRLDVAAEMTLQHLDLRQLYGFIAPKTKLQAEGTVDAFVKLRVHEAQLEGSVKPVIENLKILPAEASFKPELEAWLANAGVGMASDRVPGRNGIATVVPIGGTVENPKVELWPAMLVMLHNAYQSALPKDFSHLPAAPPGTAPDKGKVAQVADALTKKQFPAVPVSGKDAAKKNDGK